MDKMKNLLRYYETILIHTSLQRGVGQIEDDRTVSTVFRKPLKTANQTFIAHCHLAEEV